MTLLWWTQISLPATKCCNYSIVTLNLDGDKSRVFYCQFKSNSKTVSTKSNNIHVDSKLPNSDWITQTDIPHDIQLLSLFWGQSIDLLFISNVFFFQDLISSKRFFLNYGLPILSKATFWVFTQLMPMSLQIQDNSRKASISRNKQIIISMDTHYPHP